MMSPHAGAVEDSRAAARVIWEAALAAVQPHRLVERALAVDNEAIVVGGKREPLVPGGRLRLLALGKAAPALAQAVATRLDDRHADGLVITKEGHARGPMPPRVEVVEAGHPLPDARSVRAGARVIEFLGGGRADDLVLVLVTGGASALVCVPRPPLTLDAIEAVTALLLRSGADIDELNTVRKHMDLVKGGGLLRMAAPARVVALLISDVIGDSPATIGSGVAAADPTTFAAALAILDRRAGGAPAAVRDLFARGARGEEAETLKPADALASRARSHILGSGAMAAEAAAEKAAELGFRSLVLSTEVAGEAREVGRMMAAQARAIRGAGDPAPPVALIWAGETTVTVRGAGRGGRNQELALAAAMVLDGVRDICLAALGTDGTDGPTDAAGALVDGSTARAAREAGLDLAAALERNDSYPTLDALHCLIRTGPTGTHVNDLGLALIGAGGTGAGAGAG